MSHPITLFTGQWTDLPLGKLAPLAKKMGFEGVELACWGDHFDVELAAKSGKYVRDKWALLQDNGLTCLAISNHPVGQAVCDRIDWRHQAILPADVWGDGEPEGVRKRAAKKLITTAKAARAFFLAKPGSNKRKSAKLQPVPVVNGFTGSSIWHAVYDYPPTSQAFIEQGYLDFARRFYPILDAFDKLNVNFALEVHPTEIAFDLASSQRAVAAVNGHRRFGFNFDPSHLGYQGVDYVAFIRTFGRQIFHVHMKDVAWGQGDGRVGVYGGHTAMGEACRYWNFRSLGHGDIRFEEIIRALNDVGYRGPLSVEWEDLGMDRIFGATESAAFARKLDFPLNRSEPN